MESQNSRAIKWWRLFGNIYFVGNLLLFVALFGINIEGLVRYRQISTGWLYLGIPFLGMMSGYWTRQKKFGWWRSLLILFSLIISALILFIGLVIGPQLDNLKQEKFKQSQKEQVQ